MESLACTQSVYIPIFLICKISDFHFIPENVCKNTDYIASVFVEYIHVQKLIKVNE